MDLLQQAQAVDARHADIEDRVGERIPVNSAGLRPSAKLSHSKPSLPRVRSRTHRMELSSSTIHTLLS